MVNLRPGSYFKITYTTLLSPVFIDLLRTPLAERKKVYGWPMWWKEKNILSTFMILNFPIQTSIDLRCSYIFLTILIHSYPKLSTKNTIPTSISHGLWHMFSHSLRLSYMFFMFSHDFPTICLPIFTQRPRAPCRRSQSQVPCSPWWQGRGPSRA